jgi:hypothetical protein
MSMHPVLVKLPKQLYRRVEKRAKQTRRSVESELLAVVAQAMATEDELPEELSTSLEELSLLDDKALWRVARKGMKASETTQMEKLHFRRRQKGLSESESQALARLVGQYEKHMLLRAQAIALLKQRGYDVTKLLTNA